jgi:hypothetical protein
LSGSERQKLKMPSEPGLLRWRLSAWHRVINKSKIVPNNYIPIWNFCTFLYISNKIARTIWLWNLHLKWK